MNNLQYLENNNQYDNDNDLYYNYKNPRSTIDNDTRETLNYKFFNIFKVFNILIRECVGEMVGIYFYLLLLLSNLCTYFLYPESNITWLGVAFSSGMSLTIGIIISSYICNSYLNPGISLCDYIEGNIKFIDLISYTAHHLLGAFLAAATTYGIYYTKIKDSDDILVTKIFATIKLEDLNNVSAFFTEFTGSALITMFYFIFFKHHITVKCAPIYVGIGMLCIVLSFGYQTTFAFNVARDLGPRIFLSITGYNSFNYYDNYFWIPLVADYIGSIFGLLLYKIFFKSQVS